MRTVIGVMGSGEHVSAEVRDIAYELGAAIASRGWVLLNGGRSAGVMDASAHGAADAGGFVIGVLPGEDSRGASRHLSVAIRTGMGDARNAINVASSDVVVALHGGAGTLSEIALALKAGRPVVALAFDPGTGFARWVADGRLVRVDTVADAIAAIEVALSDQEDERRT